VIDDDAPETPSERVALVAWHLIHGEGLTVKQVAAMVGITRRRAGDMLGRIGRVVPLFCDPTGVWQVTQGGAMLQRIETANQDAADAARERIETVNQDAANQTAAKIATVNTEVVNRMNQTARKLARERGETWL
jgi:hypothetical protein